MGNWTHQDNYASEFLGRKGEADEIIKQARKADARARRTAGLMYWMLNAGFAVAVAAYALNIAFNTPGWPIGIGGAIMAVPIAWCWKEGL
ncbi:MAG: hypothetical protein P4L67_04390 [Candidatus Pacebacteria bacterium]|nr:hypothetical protein [Candidatus Paceibacterota bacterium]